MEFNFPFPSLKQLAILRICQHWSDQNLGVFSVIRKNFSVTTDSESNPLIPFRMFRVFKYMVKQLSIPDELKIDVSKALFGICAQIRNWARYYPRYPSIEKFYFDSYGIFDIERTIEHFYKKQVAATENLHFLHELLSEAAQRLWLSEIDMVLRKMVAVVIQLVEDPLQGLCYHRQNKTLEMRYRFRRNLNSKIIGKIRSLSSFTSEYASIGTYKKCLFVKLSPTWWSMKLIEKQLIHGLLKREVDVKDLIECMFYESHIPASYLLKVLTHIKNSKRRSWISYVDTDTQLHSYIRQLLYHLLTWPFTMFFAPALKSLCSTLDADLCFSLFEITYGAVFLQQYCGIWQGNLLIEFWSVVPTHIKRELAVNHREFIDKALKIFREQAVHKHAIEIYDILTSELDDLDPRKWRNRLRPRKRKHE